MNWQRLKNFKCPKCNNDLENNHDYYDCHSCKFMISKEKFKLIVNEIYNRKSYLTSDEEKNLSDLNNL